MTGEEREKAIDLLDNLVGMIEDNQDNDYDFALKKGIEALKQDLNMEQFAKWVATELFDDDWKYNRYVFAEIACRKLAKLGIVRKNGDIWELVEPQESEDKK